MDEPRSDFVDHINRVRTNFGESLALIHHLGYRPGTLIDVGVAFGTPELYRAFPDSDLILIEPVEEFRSQLERLAEERRNVRYTLSAAGAEDGEIEIWVSEDKSGSALHPLGNADRRRVPMIRLDSLCRDWQLRSPYVIKVDVQGHELDVMEGSKGVLQETLAVVLEVSLIATAPNVPEFYEVVTWMHRHGFVVYDVMGGHNRPLDLARCQTDVVFVAQDGPLRAERRWATAEQVAQFMDAKRSRSGFREIMTEARGEVCRLAEHRLSAHPLRGLLPGAGQLNGFLRLRRLGSTGPLVTMF
jgi:FkbM family methyltransferase